MPTPQKRVIIAPLAWGLGHATRCIPVVNALLKLKCKVWAVLTEPQHTLYQPIFGNRIEYIAFDEVPVDYRGSFSLAMLRQIPRFSAQMRRESSLAEWLNEKLKPHLFISDNRYGFKSPHTPSVLISHQLQLRAGWFGNPATRFVHSMMRGFDAILVPDNENAPNLSGVLSHGELPENEVSYIGPLSRLSPAPLSPNPKYDWLALLSGPEPQRTKLEELLVSAAAESDIKLAIVAGQPEKGTASEKSGNIERFPHLQDVALRELVAHSKAIVCRSGYSTLCDLSALQRRALLIPTPGQTEQKYLAKHFSEQFGFRTIHQRNQRNLRRALQAPEVHSEPFLFDFEDTVEATLKAWIH